MKRLLFVMYLFQLAGCTDDRDGDVGESPTGGMSETSPQADGVGDATGDDGVSGSDDGAAPMPEPVGPSEHPSGRRLRRVSVAQFAASLEVATGQRWPDVAQFANAMGEANFVETTEEDLGLTVAFEKFAQDAALYTCRAAVEADLRGGDTILRYASPDETDEEHLRENLRYLLLRFLGQDVATDSSSLDPWLELVTSVPLPAERWTAVCVGLITHPDFLAY